MPSNPKPSLSVIMVCLNAASIRENCLAALASQSIPSEIEVLAIGHGGHQSIDLESESGYPQVRWINAPEQSTVPQMRARGIAASSGEIVALLEDDCIVPPGWCREVIRAHQRAEEAIGGAIAPDERYTLRDWAVFFCEYARFLPPFAGKVPALPGNNVSYKRRLVLSIGSEDSFYDVFFHWQLQRSGKILFADSELIVYNVNRWSLAHVTTLPFHHGRTFASMRSDQFSSIRRSLYAVLSFGLIPAKIVRIGHEVFSRKQYRSKFLLSLPWTFLFMTSWSIGEFSGYAFSEGDSASYWR